VNASDPAHASYTPATVAKFEEIKAYFRNVAVWMAKPSLQSCIRNGGWIRVLGDFDIAITHRKLDFIKDRKLYFWQLGVFAKDALGRSASQCQLLAWVIWYLYPKTLALRTNPFKSRPAFGDIKNPEKLLDDDGKKFEAVLKEGASLGIKEFAELIEKRNDTLKSIMKEF